MPEPLASREDLLIQSLMSSRPVLAETMRSAPGELFDIPEQEDVPGESLFHPVKAFHDLLEAIGDVSAKLDLILKQQLKERTFDDIPVACGATFGYTADYKERKYIYAFSNAAVTLLYNLTTTKALAANTWVNLSPPRGTVISVQAGSDVAPQIITFRLCDVIMN